MSKHTPGPWAVHSAYPWIINRTFTRICCALFVLVLIANACGAFGA